MVICLVWAGQWWAGRAATGAGAPRRAPARTAAHTAAHAPGIRGTAHLHGLRLSSPPTRDPAAPQFFAEQRKAREEAEAAAAAKQQQAAAAAAARKSENCAAKDSKDGGKRVSGNGGKPSGAPRASHNGGGLAAGGASGGSGGNSTRVSANGGPAPDPGAGRPGRLEPIASVDPTSDEAGRRGAGEAEGRGERRTPPLPGALSSSSVPSPGQGQGQAPLPSPTHNGAKSMSAQAVRRAGCHAHSRVAAVDQRPAGWAPARAREGIGKEAVTCRGSKTKPGGGDS